MTRYGGDTHIRATLFGLASLLAVSPAMAVQFETDWGPGFDMQWSNKFALGAQWRLASPNRAFIGKSNLDPNLCAADACISLSRENTEPHERWMAAPGASWQLGDEANLMHDKGDVTSGVIRWRSDLSIKASDANWGLELSWQTFYDRSVDEQHIQHPNLIVAEGPAPGTATAVDMPAHAIDETRWQLDIRDAYLHFRMPGLNANEIDVRIGRQQMGWGEALFAISGTLNFINPINFNNFFRPTMDLDEALEPVAMINLATPLSDKLAAEAFYQLEWRPYTLPSRGTLGSFIVDLGSQPENRGQLSDDSLPLPFGKTPEDPLQLQRDLTPVVALISDTSASIPRLNNREPDPWGQFGFKLSYFDPDLLGGTELSLYYAHYHARLPAASFLAADATCASAEGSATGEDPQPGIFPIGLLNFLQACGRNAGSLLDLVNDLTADNPKLVGDGYDALPLDTARIFLDYPENIQVLGLGFNTAALGLSWSGELAFRPDYPFQVDLEDIFFTALQPIFPRQELALVPAEMALLNPLLGPLSEVLGLPLDELAGATFTDRRNALPDYLTAYRGGVPGEVAPGSYIRGYEEFDFWQGSLGASKILGRRNNWLLADQTVLILEFSASYVPDLPPLSTLQLDSLATTNTHYSPGIEDTGDPLKLNPFAQDGSGFPTSFAWGYKAAAIWAYDDLFIPGLRVRPQVILFHDVDGTTPGLGGNFQHGRKIALAGINFNYRNRLSLAIDHFIFFGGGQGNRLSDRDFINASISVVF